MLPSGSRFLQGTQDNHANQINLIVRLKAGHAQDRAAQEDSTVAKGQATFSETTCLSLQLDLIHEGRLETQRQTALGHQSVGLKCWG